MAFLNFFFFLQYVMPFSYYMCYLPGISPRYFCNSYCLSNFCRVTDLKKCCLVPIQMGLIILEETKGAGVQQNKLNLQGSVLKVTLCCIVQRLTDVIWNQTHIKISIKIMTFWFLSL